MTILYLTLNGVHRYWSGYAKTGRIFTDWGYFLMPPLLILSGGVGKCPKSHLAWVVYKGSVHRD